jgi:hypothetical protein
LEYWIASSDWADREKLAQVIARVGADAAIGTAVDGKADGAATDHAADTLWESVKEIAYQSETGRVKSWQ